MADEKITIELDLEVNKSKSNKQFKKIEDNAAVSGVKSGVKFVKGFQRNVSNKISASLKNAFLSPLRLISSQLVGIGAAIGSGFLFKKAIDESSKLQNALIGLKSTAGAFGITNQEITREAQALAADGLIPLTDVTDSLKNLLRNFDGDLQKSVNTFKAFRDAAAFGRQGQLALGEAIRGASEGLKNDLSIKVDNAGITKNLSILQKEYAASIGVSVANLTSAQKAQAEYLGIQREAAINQGDYNKLTQTFNGTISGLQTSFRFLLVAIGDFVTKSPAVLTVINAISLEIQKLTMFLNQQGGQGFKNFVLGALKAGEAINDYIVRPLSFALDAFNIFFRGVNTGVAALVAGFAQVGAVVSDIIKLFGGENALTQAFDNFDASSTEVFLENMNGLKDTMDGAFGAEASEKIGLFFSNLREEVELTSPKLIELGNGAVKGAKAAAIGIDKSAQAINKSMNQALGNGVANGIQKVTQALVAGENVFKAFGQAVLGLVADMAIQMGKIFVATGVAQLALFATPGASILAGAALIAAGTVAKSIFGGGDSGSPGGVGAGSVAGGGAASFGESTEVAQVEPEEPDTKVAITIQGDVFDSEESGLRIAQILESASLNQNVTVVGAA